MSRFRVAYDNRSVQRAGSRAATWSDLARSPVLHAGPLGRRITEFPFQCGGDGILVLQLEDAGSEWEAKCCRDKVVAALVREAPSRSAIGRSK